LRRDGEKSVNIKVLACLNELSQDNLVEVVGESIG